MLPKNLFLHLNQIIWSSYQLGQINDNIFGKSEASFVTQLNLSEFDPIFGKWDTEKKLKEIQIMSL